MLIQVNQINKYFADKPILEGVTFNLTQVDRMGLIGKNGVGKTTLLKIIAGLSEYDSGEITRMPDMTIGYLQQDIDFDNPNTVMQEMQNVIPEIPQLERRMRDLEIDMSNLDSKDSVAYTRMMKEYGELQHHYEWLDGYMFQSKIYTILNGLGFSKDVSVRNISTLSGGEKMRLNLGKLLLREPDLLLLDEPNNHLDLETLAWLEEYLQKWKKAMIVISHDRDFLDRVVTNILELENRQVVVYKANYSGYVELKAKRREQEEKQFKQQQQKLDHLNAFVTRFKYKATKARQAKSKEKAISRMEPVKITHVSKKRMKVRFSLGKPSEKEVLHAEGLGKKIGNRTIFQDVDFNLSRGDKVGLLGPNGVGKSSLLRILVGNDTQHEGTIRIASRVKVGYFAQDLPMNCEDHRVLDEITSMGIYRAKDARDLLGLFLFSGEDVEKNIHQLSGGERNRLALAKLVTHEANLLVLDEPTNHLDIESREVLEQALADFPGTIIMVSHDRYFLRKVVNRVFVLNPHGIDYYPYGFEQYMEHLKEDNGRIEIATIPRSRREVSRPDEQRRKTALWKQQIKEVEARIQTAEEHMNNLELELGLAQTYEKGSRTKDVIQEYNQLQEDIRELYQLWETIHDSKP